MVRTDGLVKSRREQLGSRRLHWHRSRSCGHLYCSTLAEDVLKPGGGEIDIPFPEPWLPVLALDPKTGLLIAFKVAN